MTFKISTLEKKNVIQVERWTKNGVTLIHSTGWRWGTATFKDKPDLSDYDEEYGIDIYSMDIEDHELDDGCWEEWEYIQSAVGNQEQVDDYREEVEEYLELNGFADLEDMGWESEDSELLFRGPLEVTEE